MTSFLSTLFIASCFVSIVACQDLCTWSTADGTGKTHATGSDAVYVINSTTTLKEFVTYTFLYNSSVAAQLTYSSGGFVEYNPNTRVKARATKVADDLVLLSAQVLAVTSSDNGLILQISRTPCTTGAVGSNFVLTVKDCNKGLFYPNATASSTSTCGYGCQELFVCNGSTCLEGSFLGECQADATWNISRALCSVVTCDILPPFMQFRGAILNVACGSRAVVECNGGSALCGNTTGTCPSTGGNVTLEDTDFSCSAVCDLGLFSNVSTSTFSSPRCGEAVDFQCLQNSSCDQQTFRRVCNKNGNWNQLDPPCKKSCPSDILWVIVPALGAGLLLIILLIKVIFYSCCNEKDRFRVRNDAKNTCIWFAPVAVAAESECLKACSVSSLTLIQASYFVIVYLTFPAASIALLVLDIAVVLGIILGWILILALLVECILVARITCTKNENEKKTNNRVGQDPTSGGADQFETVKLKENSSQPVDC